MLGQREEGASVTTEVSREEHARYAGRPGPYAFRQAPSLSSSAFLPTSQGSPSLRTALMLAQDR
jgi:hypothetical protein